MKIEFDKIQASEFSSDVFPMPHGGDRIELPDLVTLDDESIAALTADDAFELDPASPVDLDAVVDPSPEEIEETKSDETIQISKIENLQKLKSKISPGKHLVVQGECLANLAARSGHLPETIWDRPENEKLKTQRADPHVLLPGDEIFIPPPQPKTLALETGSRHTVELQGTQTTLRLKPMFMGFNRANTPCKLSVAGLPDQEKSTNDKGIVEFRVPATAYHATLSIAEGPPIALEIGALDPTEEDSGIVGRLINLGYLVDGDASLAVLEDAIHAFQSDHGLDPTGELDENTRAKIEELHDAEE